MENVDKKKREFKERGGRENNIRLQKGGGKKE